MRLEAGRRLGPYEIVCALGAGGMGEVYEAIDTRLGRTVAVKVLPSELALHPERRARFEREARSVSKVSHPHVCALYDIGEDDAIHFLVLEHCEGETLESRLKRGALPMSDVLRFGSQIAEALDAAHGRGIVHRDLKPGNVILTGSGVKLLDFGLARVAAGEGDGNAPMAEMATLARNADRSLTAEGTILGTYPYMAPEQVEGGAVDARSDIFSLGAVLYEMVTGKRAFDGKSAASVMAAVLKEEPQPLSKAQPVAPPAFDHVVSRCLAKNPEERWQSARDVAVELRWIAEAGSQSGVAAPVAKRRRSRERLAWGIATVAIVLAGVATAFWVAERRTGPRLIRAELASPERWQFDPDRGFALSPDGSHIVFSAHDERERSMLWVRPIGAETARAIEGTSNGQDPFWSPDGKHIGFFASGELKRISLAGGPAQTLCAATGPRGGTWGEDGTIIFNGEFRKGLFRVPATGGTPEEVTRIGEGEISHRWPHFLPGGRNLLFLVQRAEGGVRRDDSSIEALQLAGGERRSLVRANSSMAYAPTGHLLFWREGTLLAQRFDPGELAMADEEPFPLATGVGYTFQEWANFSISAEGTLIYARGSGGRGPSQLAWFDRNGTRVEQIGPPQQMDGPALSHDGTRVAFAREGDIWIRDLERDTLTRLTFHPAPDFSPVWSPDDRWIAFTSVRDRPRGMAIFRKAASGAGEPERLLDVPEDGEPLDWSHDGEHILFQEMGPESRMELKVLSVRTGESKDLLPGEDFEVMGRYSPDDRWVAYAAGGEEVRIFAATSGGSGRWQVSSRSSFFPQWSPDGRQILYLEAPNRIMAADVDTVDGVQVGHPRLLFEAAVDEQFSLHPDGQRILVSLEAEKRTNPSMDLVLNWPRLLVR